MPGPAPKPTALRVLEGNPSHRPLNVLEPQPAIVTLEPPAFLGEEARTEWLRLMPVLEAHGLMTALDVGCLAAYCVAFGRWVEAEKKVAENGATVRLKSGYEQKSAWLTIADRAWDQMVKALQQFGLSPASRSRVTASAPTDGDDFFAVRQ